MNSRRIFTVSNETRLRLVCLALLCAPAFSYPTMYKPLFQSSMPFVLCLSCVFYVSSMIFYVPSVFLLCPFHITFPMYLSEFRKQKRKSRHLQIQNGSFQAPVAISRHLLPSYPLFKFLYRKRPGVIVPLHHIALDTFQEFNLFPGFNSFGNRLYLQPPG